MNKKHNSVFKQIRKSKITRAVIATIAVTGFLSVALVLPNAVSALGAFGPRNQKARIEESIKKLIKKGYLVLTKRDGVDHIELTEKGRRFAVLFGETGFCLKQSKKWDSKWHMLIFDIPERKKILRDKLRQTLGVIGFVRLQDSVWVYPYNCEDLITLLKVDFKIGREMLYLIVDKIEGDDVLRRNFELD